MTQPDFQHQTNSSSREATVATQKVFISYATEDSQSVVPFLEAFERAGVEVWIDHQQIGHGQSIVELIDDAISGCAVALVFYSKIYQQKPWTKEERRALVYQFVESNREESDGRAIFVVNLDDTLLPPTLAHRLWKGNSSPAEVVRGIQAWMGQAPSNQDVDNATSTIDNFLVEMNGIALEQVAVQLLEQMRDAPIGKEPLRLVVFVKSFGQVCVECMPRPACDNVLQEIEALLHQANAHRRFIGSYQQQLAEGGMGIYDEAFRIALDKKIAALDAVHFSPNASAGLLEQLESLILSVSR